jgi:hypothetical protein
MPVHKVDGGWQWGSHGKVYKTKKEAEAQGKAAHANGYKGRKKRKRGASGMVRSLEGLSGIYSLKSRPRRCKRMKVRDDEEE